MGSYHNVCLNKEVSRCFIEPQVFHGVIEVYIHYIDYIVTWPSHLIYPWISYPKTTDFNRDLVPHLLLQQSLCFWGRLSTRFCNVAVGMCAHSAKKTITKRRLQCWVRRPGMQSDFFFIPKAFCWVCGQGFCADHSCSRTEEPAKCLYGVCFLHRVILEHIWALTVLVKISLNDTAYILSDYMLTILQQTLGKDPEINFCHEIKVIIYPLDFFACMPKIFMNVCNSSETLHNKMQIYLFWCPHYSQNSQAGEGNRQNICCTLGSLQSFFLWEQENRKIVPS